MITLEGAQAGLSWEMVLKKREHYRKVFKGFDPKVVARYTARQVEELLQDPGIIRNRLKINSTVSNARAFLKVQDEFGSFDRYIWGFAGNTPVKTRIKKAGDYPTHSGISDIISEDLKKRGFRFVGSTIIYAYMQAIGLTNDHAVSCFLH